MRQILTSLFVLVSVALSAQNFTFECICNAQMTGDSCDICPGTPITSRSFTGLLIYRNGVEYKWIDEPYMVRLRPDENVEFLEQGPNPDKVTIALYQTPFYTIGGFLDSTFCQCNDAIKPLWYATDSTNVGPIFRGDTLMITGWGGTTVTYDSVLQKYIIYSATGGGGGSYTAGTGIDITGTVISNTGDLSNTNELQTIANTSDGTSHTATLSNSGGSVKIVEGTGIGLATTGTTLDGIVTVTNTGDLSSTNEAQTLSVSGTSTGIISLNVISGTGGGTATIAGAGINAVSQSGGAITITGTEVDGALANEGVLGVGAGSATSSVVLSNTAGATGVTINAGTGISISETTSSNGGQITITNSSPATSSWLLDGNTVGSLKTIGTNDSIDLPFETNGIIRGRFAANGGDFLINSTTTGNKLNVEGLGASGVCARFSGGNLASLNSNVVINGNATTTVYGINENMTVSGASNNLINRFRNGSTGNVLNQIIVSSSGGDPMQQFQTEGASGHTWVTGIDNSLADKFRIEPNPAIGDDELGLHIEKTSEFGFGKAASTSHSGVWGLAKPLGLPSGASSSRAFGINPAIWYNSTVSRTEIFCASHNIYKGITSNGTPTISNIYSNAGTGATVTLSTGSNDIAGQITLTTGTTGLLAGQQFELQFAGAFSGQVFVFLQSRSATYSAQNTNFFVGTQGTGSFKVDVATALAPSTAYIFNYKVEQ